MPQPTRIEGDGRLFCCPLWPWDETPGAVLITSPFGPRTHPVTGVANRHHNGVDLGIAQGTKLRPVAVGHVSKLWRDHSLNGHAIRVDHGHGWWSAYVHLSEILVELGDRVAPSEVMARSGGARGTPGAGRSTGPHLHLGLWERTVSGQYRAVDPVPRIDWRPWTLERR